MTTGFICTLLGMLLFFEGNLLRIGNVSDMTNIFSVQDSC